MHISHSVRPYVSLLLTSVFLIALSVEGVHAQEARLMAPPPTHEERTLTETEQNRFINLTRNSHSLMEGAVNRLSQITVRMESRVTELEAKGINTSLVREPLTQATALLLEAGSKLPSAKAHAESALVSDLPQSSFLTAYREYKDIETLIYSALIQLQESLAELRDAVAEAEINGDIVAIGGPSPLSQDAQ